MADSPMKMRDIATASVLWCLSGSVFVVGVLLGRALIKPRQDEGDRPLASALCRADGRHFKNICENGYSYDPEARSVVAFFPAYPLLARAVARGSAWPTEWALLLVANACSAAAFVLLYAYARMSRPGAPPSFPGYVVAAFGVFPTACFFRLPYSESLFVTVVLLALIGMAREWPFWLTAVVIGLGTATRPVGVALVPPFILHLWQRSDTGTRFITRSWAYGPVACWGLLAYAAFQWHAFGEPLAFVKTQKYWTTRSQASVAEKAEILVSLEPIWGAFVPGHELCLLNLEDPSGALFSLITMNPAIFAGVAILVGCGAYYRQLDGKEVLLAAGLLLIPYVTKGFDYGMNSTGRFAAVVLPAYLVIGGILVRIPGPVSALVLALSGLLMAIYSAEFVSGYMIF